ncbi:MAG TPA: hypothetical protein VNN25_13845 [Thermoanaerobaculia bacterium]|nr:hypothetical protein [Thermoanaerobaculia bacterium]
MNRKPLVGFFALLFSILAFLIVAAPAIAQDAVTVGTATASGNTVDVPVYIRDVAGTTLGRDQAVGSRIQAYSIKVTYAPAAAVQSVTFSRAGITAGLTPASEFSPSTTGSISLLDTFQESTNLIPFTLGAPAPGDQVAHLVFTLSSSAAPGSSISLTLDPSLTQLSNQGGDTKESVSNSGLTLTDGVINIPNLTLALVPGSRSVVLNDTTAIAAQTSAPVQSDTTVSLSSTNPNIATVPASVIIPAGSQFANFSVTAIGIGSVNINAALPASLGGASASAAVTVTEPPPQCLTPLAPVLSGPSTADAGKAYTISWNSVSNATDYAIDESTDQNFLTISTTNVTAASVSFTHLAPNRYYYRVRARNQSTGCNVSSLFSTAVSILVSVAPVAQTKILPVVGSVPGTGGSYFKTSLQFFNAKTTAISGKIVFHPQAASGSASDPSLAYVIQAGKSLFYPDLLPAMGVASGLGSADVIADAGTAFPVTLVRVFNDGGVAGTTGLALDLMALSDALQNGESGVLIAPADTRFRLNIGVRTLESGASMTLTVRDKDGAVVKTASQSFGPTFFRQLGSSSILDGYTLAGGETITVQITSGSAFVYGSTTDNTTQDPSVQFAKRIE